MNHNQDISLTQRIFSIIKDDGPVSRVAIHNDYGIRKATVTAVTQKLMENNYLSEVGETFYERGRKPVLLTINNEAFHTIGVQIKRTEIKLGLYSNGGNQKYSMNVDFDCNSEADQMTQNISDAIVQILRAATKLEIPVKAVGIAMPGIINANEGIVLRSNSFKKFKNVPLQSIIEKTAKLPVHIDNDVVCMSMAEKLFGAAKRIKNYAVVFVGEGIGCRLILDNSIYRGENNKSGELGHIPVVTEGERCYCGRSGCLENIASTSAILKRFPKAKNFEELIQFAEKGDKEVIALLDETAGYIGKGLSYIYDLLDVSLIFLTGPIISAESFLMPGIQRALAEGELLFSSSESRRVLCSRIGEEAGVKGAALLAASKVFEQDGVNIF